LSATADTTCTTIEQPIENCSFRKLLPPLHYMLPLQVHHGHLGESMIEESPHGKLRRATTAAKSQYDQAVDFTKMLSTRCFAVMSGELSSVSLPTIIL
jgi:hypothetical protein